MKIAIPEHQGRVAPVFDACRRILVYARQDDTHMLLAPAHCTGTEPKAVLKSHFGRRYHAAGAGSVFDF